MQAVTAALSAIAEEYTANQTGMLLLNNQYLRIGHALQHMPANAGEPQWHTLELVTHNYMAHLQHRLNQITTSILS